MLNSSMNVEFVYLILHGVSELLRNKKHSQQKSEFVN